MVELLDVVFMSERILMEQPKRLIVPVYPRMNVSHTVHATLGKQQMTYTTIRQELMVPVIAGLVTGVVKEILCYNKI